MPHVERTTGNAGHGAQDNQPFRHYSLKHQVVSWISRALFDNLTYTVRRGMLRGMKRKGGLAWIPGIPGFGKKTPEELFFRRLDVSGKVVFDVGAFEGLVTLFFARSARHVVSYEPNPRNYARLCRNLDLNGVKNVTVRRFGLGAKRSSAVMVWDPRRAGGATVATTGMSATIGREVGARNAEIQVTTLDQDFSEAHLPEPDLIKVDVEGLELQVLQGARHLLQTRHPELYLEIHGETMNEKRANAQAVIDYLNGIGYADLVHVESGEKITLENSGRASQGHLFARMSQPTRFYDSSATDMKTLDNPKSVVEDSGI